MATNYLGPFLLTMRLLPHLQAAATVRPPSTPHPALLRQVLRFGPKCGHLRSIERPEPPIVPHSTQPSFVGNDWRRSW